MKNVRKSRKFYIYEIVKEEKWKKTKEKLAIDVILTTPNQQPATATSSGVQAIIIFNNNIKYLTRLTQLRAASLAHTENTYLTVAACLSLYCYQFLMKSVFSKNNNSNKNWKNLSLPSDKLIEFSGPRQSHKIYSQTLNNRNQRQKGRKTAHSATILEVMLPYHTHSVICSAIVNCAIGINNSNNSNN